MPTYEYVCKKCGHQFEEIQSIAAKPLNACPKEKCALKRWGKGKVQRSISGGAGLLFKGSGFYITDYRSDNYKQAAKKDSAPAASTGGETKPAGDSKPAGESKPAAKSDSVASKPTPPKKT